MEVLSSRFLIRTADTARSRRFYRDTLGLAVHREYGPPDDPGMVFHLGGGLLEVSAGAAGTDQDCTHGSVSALWLHVRDVRREYDRLVAAGVRVLREPKRESWGLIEAWIVDPDGLRLVLVEIPDDHPLRRDQRQV